MVANVRVTFGLVQDQVKPALEGHTKEYKASRAAINLIEGSYKELERVALRAIRSTENEQSKLNRTTVGLTRLVKAEILSQKEALAVLRERRAELDGSAASQRKNALLAEKIRETTGLEVRERVRLARLLESGKLNRRQALAILERMRAKQAELNKEQAETNAAVARMRKELAPILTRQREIVAAARLANVPRERTLDLVRQIRAEMDGTAAAAARDAAAVAKLRRAQAPILTQQKAIVREYKRENIERHEALRLVRAIRAASRESKSDQVDTNSLLSAMGSRLAGIASTYASINTLIGVGSRLIQDRLQLLQEATASVELQGAGYNELFITTGDASFTPEIRQRAFSLAREARDVIGTVSLDQAFEQFATILSATSSKDPGPAGANERVTQAFEAYLGAGRTLPLKPESLGDLGQAFVAIQRVADTVPDLTRAEAKEALIAVRSQAMITDTQQLLNVVPVARGAIQVSEFGGGKVSREDFFSALSLFGAVSTSSEDIRGELTRTFGSKFFAETLREQIPDSIARGTSEKLELLFSDPRYQNRVYKNLEGRGFLKISGEALIRGLGDVRDNFFAISEVLKQTAKGTALAEQIEKDPFLNLARTGVSAEKFTDAFLSESLGRAGAQQKIFEQAQRISKADGTRLGLEALYLSGLVSVGDLLGADRGREIGRALEQLISVSKEGSDTQKALLELQKQFNTVGPPPDQTKALPVPKEVPE